MGLKRQGKEFFFNFSKHYKINKRRKEEKYNNDSELQEECHFLYKNLSKN